MSHSIVTSVDQRGWVRPPATMVAALLFVLFAALVSVVTLPMAPAHAECTGPPIMCGVVGGGEQGDSGDLGDDDPSQPPSGGDSDGDGGTDNGGSGGITTPGTFGYSGITWQPRNPPGPLGSNSFLGLIWGAGSNSYSYGGKCEGNYAWQDNRGVSRSAKWLGTSWTLSGTHRPAYIDPATSDAIPDTYTATAGGYQCIPPPEYTIYKEMCVIKAVGKWVGPTNNGSGVPEATHPMGKSLTDFALGGKNNPDLCFEPSKFSFQSTGLVDPGQYALIINLLAQPCEITRWNTVNQKLNRYNKDTIFCAGPLDSVDNDTDLLELFCAPPYIHRGVWHDNHKFNTEDCDEGVTWGCGPTPQPSFEGRTGPVFEVLDDGKPRTLKWPQPTLSGDVRDWENDKQSVRLALGDEISPFRAGESSNGDRQPYTVFPSVDKWVGNWTQALPASSKNTGWDLAFMAPGVKDKAWSVTPAWAFRAEFLQKQVTGATYNAQTGKFDVVLEDNWYRDSGTCAGAPADLNVFRARSSHGG